MFAAEAAATAHPLEPAERDARMFLKQAAASSRFQADAARLAIAKSSNARVRSLAARLRDRHGAAGDDLLRMLHQRGLAQPMLENVQRRTLTRLARAQGKKFDRDYVAAVLLDTRGALASCERAGSSVQDAAIANWIAARLPVLRSDADQIERLSASLPAAPLRAAPAAKVHQRARRHGHTKRHQGVP